MLVKYPLVFSFNEKKICIHRRVLRRWKHSRQLAKRDTEKFGILIGRKDKENIYIDFVTKPYKQDESTRYSFKLKDNKHQKTVSRAFERTQGKLGYVGTWHTHPEDYPAPSNIDRKDWERCIKRNQDRDLFFFIVGRKDIYLFYKKHNQFIKIRKDKDE